MITRPAHDILKSTLVGALAFSAWIAPQSGTAAGGAALSSDIQFWERPQTGDSAGNSSAGVLPRGTILEVFHKMTDGKGREQSYVRISSGPYVGRYVWVNSKYPAAPVANSQMRTGSQSQPSPSHQPQARSRNQSPQALARPQVRAQTAAESDASSRSQAASGGPISLKPQAQDEITESAIRWNSPRVITKGDPSHGDSKDDTQMEARLTPCDLGLCDRSASTGLSGLGKLQIAATQLNGIVSQAAQPDPALNSRALSQVTWGGADEGGQWSQIVSEALQDFGAPLVESVPKDVASFCPSYESMSDEGRRGFWVQFMSGLTEVESTFRPNVSHKEKFKNSKKQYVMSRGLLQISLESAQGYYCPLDEDSELLDARMNLECGIRILTKWVKNDGRIVGASKQVKRNGRLVESSKRTLEGGSRYWGSLRNSRKIGIVQSRTRAYCQAMSSVPSI